MASSGSSTFTLNLSQAITLALRKLNVLQFGASPDSISIAQATQSINIMLKAWQSEGIKLWTIYDLPIPYTVGKTQYVIGESGVIDVNAARPLKVLQAYLRNNTNTPVTDQIIYLLSRNEYTMLGSKFQSGDTNSLYYDPQLPNGLLNVYLTPDTITAADNTLYITVQRPIYDMVTTSDNFDLPAEWMQAVVWGLADEMAEDYNIPDGKVARIQQKAQMYKEQLKDWDQEWASVYFQPDPRMQYMNDPTA